MGRYGPIANLDIAEIYEVLGGVAKAKHYNWPAPEIHARQADEHEIPRGARLVNGLALRCGWKVLATYARGTVPTRAPRVVDSLALRMAKDKRRAVAVWEDSRFATAVLFGDRWPSKCNVTRLRAELELG